MSPSLLPKKWHRQLPGASNLAPSRPLNFRHSSWPSYAPSQTLSTLVAPLASLNCTPNNQVSPSPQGTPNSPLWVDTWLALRSRVISAPPLNRNRGTNRWMHEVSVPWHMPFQDQGMPLPSSPPLHLSFQTLDPLPARLPSSGLHTLWPIQQWPLTRRHHCCALCLPAARSSPKPGRCLPLIYIMPTPERGLPRHSTLEGRKNPSGGMLKALAAPCSFHQESDAETGVPRGSSQTSAPFTVH